MVAIVYTDPVGSGPDWMMTKPNKSLFQYLEQTSQSAMQNLTAATQQLVSKAGDVFQRVTYSDAMRKARAVMREASVSGSLNTVKELQTMAELQHARPGMQRYIMADPVVRELYHKGGCSGYEGSYVDNAPDQSGVDHYDYRRVTNGMWIEEEKTGTVSMSAFYEDTGEDEELDVNQQMDIMRTWDHARAALKRGKEDPTSPENDML